MYTWTTGDGTHRSSILSHTTSLCHITSRAGSWTRRRLETAPASQPPAPHNVSICKGTVSNPAPLDEAVQAVGHSLSIPGLLTNLLFFFFLSYLSQRANCDVCCGHITIAHNHPISLYFRGIDRSKIETKIPMSQHYTAVPALYPPNAKFWLVVGEGALSLHSSGP